MHVSKRHPPFLSGVPEFLVLRLLSEREMYGYEIVDAINVTSSEVLVFKEGVIYPLLHDLNKRRMLKVRRVKVGGRERIYYLATARGRKRFTELRATWDITTSAISSVIGAVVGE